MLGWLDGFWHRLTGYVADPVRIAVHWAMHALASVVFSVFRLVGGAWRFAFGAMASLHEALADIARAIWDKFRYVILVIIPGVVRWAAAGFTRLGAALLAAWRWVEREVARLYDWIALQVTRLARWVITDIWDPLKAYADKIWHDLLAWGFVAWWWITHLADLAEAMIFHIAAAAEKHAWQLGRLLGRFALALVVRNLRQFVTLVEDIVTAVL